MQRAVLSLVATLCFVNAITSWEHCRGRRASSPYRTEHAGYIVRHNPPAFISPTLPGTAKTDLVGFEQNDPRAFFSQMKRRDSYSRRRRRPCPRPDRQRAATFPALARRSSPKPMGVRIVEHRFSRWRVAILPNNNIAWWPDTLE